MKKSLKEGDIIRNKETGKPYLVIWINHVCMFITDPEQQEELKDMKILLKKDYDKYTYDIQMECIKHYEVYNESIIKWEYKPVFL
jgi:hypothetical protein